MKHSSVKGFTVIELILFLAIASSLILIAITSIGSRNARVQFTDGMRALEVFLDRRYSNIINGSIGDVVGCRHNGVTYDISPDPSNNDGTCVFLGLVFELDNHTTGSFDDTSRNLVKVYRLLGKRLTDAEIAACSSQDLIYCADPFILTDPNDAADPPWVIETFDIPWSIRYYGGGYKPPAAVKKDARAFAFVRRPDSTQIEPMVFYDLDPPHYLDTAELYDKDRPEASRNSAIGDEVEAVFCFGSADGKLAASMSIGSDFRQEAMDLAFKEANDYNSLCSSEWNLP